MLYFRSEDAFHWNIEKTLLKNNDRLGRMWECPDMFELDGILGFFELYYPDYAAREIHITVDYPLLNSIPQLAGIEFIEAYVEAAYYENEFCSYFSADDIHHLLCGYAKDYQELIINIYEFVLTAEIGCILAGTDPYRLDITGAGAQFLDQVFMGQSKNEILAVISKSVDELNHYFQFSQGVHQYIQESLPLIAGKIAIAAQEHTLNRIFFCPAYPENSPRIILSFGEKMNNEQYRKVIEEIGQCSFAQDKLGIIKEHIHSLADLEDILLDADLRSEDIQSILRGLGLPEIAALSKRYQLHLDIDDFGLREREQLLRENLRDFISARPQKQQELIANAVEIIGEE